MRRGPAHKAQDAVAVFPLRGLQLRQLPAKYPGLNIIENLCHPLKRRLTGRKRSRLELDSAMREKWDILLQSGVVKKRCASMPARCAAVAQAAGSPTSY